MMNLKLVIVLRNDLNPTKSYFSFVTPLSKYGFVIPQIDPTRNSPVII